MARTGLLIGATLCLASCGNARSQTRFAPTPARFETPAAVAVPPPSSLALTRDQATTLLCTALADLDHDCDRRITVDDERTADSSAAPASSGRAAARWPYLLRAADVSVTLAHLNEAAQFIQESVVALRTSGARVTLDLGRVHTDPASYLAYRIQHHYWDALTRRIDAEPQRLERAAADDKLGTDTVGTPSFCPDLDARCALRRRTVDAPVAVSAERSPPERYVYYPSDDPAARAVFEHASVPSRITVRALPEKLTPAWVLQTTRAKGHGLLTLALEPDGSGRPFVVPGGRFNEMYGWDSFFIAWGLVQDPARVELARSIIDNQAYEITHYGKILNANRTYYLTRSQPPFFTSTISAVWEHLPHDDANRRWLETALTAALREYWTVWNAPPRRLGLCEGDVCLARYSGEGRGEPPEVEPGHFDWFYQAHALSHGHCAPPGADAADRARFLSCAERLATRYRNGALADREVDNFFAHDRCVRESGHDTTFRWFEDGAERCADFAALELNVLLFKYDVDIATLLARSFGGRVDGASTEVFCGRAKARARLLEKYFWDAEAGLFYDYDTKRRARSRYLSATTLYPLWASALNPCGATLVTPEMAQRLKTAALRELEAPGGLLATAQASLARVQPPKLSKITASGDFESVVPGRQWEAPNGWAPHQMLAWVGLGRAGFEADAQRLAYRWLYTIVKNAASFHGTVPEKFDVVARSHAVFQEYGNVNTEFAYIADEGFGWMNASFVVGWRLLSPELRDALKELVEPERLFQAREP